MAKRDHEESMTPAELSDATYWAGFWSSVEHWMFLGVVLTLALEFVAVKFAEPYKGKIEKHRELETARLSKEAESARADIAKANTETAKANERAALLEKEALDLQLKLRPLTTQRMLNERQISEVISALSKFPSVRVTFVPIWKTKEVTDFTKQLANTINSALVNG